MKSEFVAVVGLLLILAAAFIYNRVEEQAELLEVAILCVFMLVLYTALLGVASWFHFKETSYKELLTKVEGSVNKLILKQRFIDQKILSVIEREAQIIWVITTKLASELDDSILEKSVEENLRNGKFYTYFLPHQDNVYFSEIKRNIRRFKELKLYKEYSSQISIVRLPINTQFLLEEVVIYNPDQEENSEDDTKGLNGFTYYEANDEEDSVHMKIEGDMLLFIRNLLDDYLTNKGLSIAVQRILADYSSFLSESQLGYLAKIINKDDIEKISEFEKFVTSISDTSKSKPFAIQILNILEPFTNKAKLNQNIV